MNAMNDSKLIEESFCSITEAIFKILPKNNLPFSLYRMNPSNGRFTPITIPGKAIVSADKQSISDDCPASGRTEKSAEKIYTDSIKLHFKQFSKTLNAVGELLHEKPDLLWLMIPMLDPQHSLVNKALSNGVIGAAVLLHAREVKPDVKIFIDALFALFLCDIGMSSLPEFVLGKEFCLSLDEQKRIRQHPIGSVEVLSLTSNLSKTSLRAILEHHERMDGSGYPRGVTNDNLSWLGKLCGA
ncbi:metal-dependent phosphohydrolase, partial [Aduncisulcus paluster]